MEMMNLVLLLCIALIFVTVNGDVEAITNSNSNSTDTTRSEAVVVVSTSSNVTDSNSKNSTQLSDDGSESSKKKERFHGEECDPSNMCKDEEDEFVACLRVPGNDAPHLSLLIQNKGKNALVVAIKAPGFVQLEKGKVQLLQNQDTKVKVSIRKGRSDDTAIVLTSTKGHCSLDLKDVAAKDNDDTVPNTRHRPSIFNISSRTLMVIVMISFLVLSLVIIPMMIHVYKKKKSQGNNNNKYQRLNMELPVSNNAGLMSKSDQEMSSGGDDGWDNNWGDDWGDGDGDEEQPNTPVLPVTPSVSSRGLASRRLSSKEGWKD